MLLIGIIATERMSVYIAAATVIDKLESMMTMSFLVIVVYHAMVNKDVCCICHCTPK